MSRLMSEGRGRSGLFLAAVIVLFFGERMFGTSEGVRLTMAVIAALLAVAGLALRLKDLSAQDGALKPAVLPLLVTQGIATGSLVLYALQTTEVREYLALVNTGTERDLFGVALGITWPMLLLVGAVPMLLLDRAAGPMWRAGAVERRRIGEAVRGGLSVALATSLLFVANYLATQHDERVDLAYYRTARPGTATIEMVQRLEEPVDVLLFFPKANDVLEQVSGYFTQLSAASPNLRVQVTDRLLDPALAKEHQVRQDGTVVLSRGTKKDRWRVGVKLKTARRELAKIDAEFQGRLAKIAEPERAAYLVTGHGELNSPDREAKGSETKRDRVVRKLLERAAYKVKTLGLSEGLGSQVPEDADLVMLLGPRRALMPEEEATLVRYVQEGGKLFLSLEPDGEDPPAAMLGALGLEFHADVLTHAKWHVRRRFDLSDRQLLATNSFSSHATVRTLSRHARELGVLVDRAGYLDRKEGAEGAKGRKVEFTVRSMGDTWADTDGDRQYDDGIEKKKVYQLAAAVTLPTKEGAADGERGRAVVVADSDLVADTLMRSHGNQLVVADGLAWLRGENAASGITESEEDVPVQHTKEEDRLWFHGTTFALPLLVLVGGLGYVRRTRRRRDV